MAVSDRMLGASAVMALLAGCAAGAPPSAPAVGGGGPVIARSVGAPFTFSDGAAARRQADAECGARGVRPTIYDRYDPATAAWVFPGGCA